MTEPIRQRSVLEVVLLNTLAEHPDGMKTADAYDWTAARYTFPEDWYREIPVDYARAGTGRRSLTAFAAHLPRVGHRE